MIFGCLAPSPNTVGVPVFHRSQALQCLARARRSVNDSVAGKSWGAQAAEVLLATGVRCERDRAGMQRGWRMIAESRPDAGATRASGMVLCLDSPRGCDENALGEQKANMLKRSCSY